MSTRRLRRSALDLSLLGHFNHGLCQLLHLHLDDELLDVSLSTVVLLLNYELALRLAITLNLSLQLVEALNHVKLGRPQFFLQVLEHGVNTAFASEVAEHFRQL